MRTVLSGERSASLLAESAHRDMIIDMVNEATASYWAGSNGWSDKHAVLLSPSIGFTVVQIEGLVHSAIKPRTKFFVIPNREDTCVFLRISKIPEKYRPRT